MLPKVTVIIPYSKDRGYLDQAVDSILAQNFDGHIEVLLSQSPGNVSYNINRAIKQATGEYIKYLCEDDMLTPNSIADSVNAIQGYDFIHGNAINFFPSGKKIQYVPPKKNPSLQDMIEHNQIHGGTLMYRKDVFDRIGLFDESLDCAEEYDFNMRCLQNGMTLGYSPRNLYLYRRHENQKSLGQEVNQIIRREKINNIINKYK
ncbi:WcaA Glycosyltransferases involved in cell wall biogenesis [uncultured Caudovirales phage]|uniref:WcaA Glycosyltransferases involved in cell wall biogenesis n=1 Tax=uncultured Caudovirales phage TaxID=2100421 RepID=A0A6J5NAK5_9CAUD|nr:WcaA Glycosyltransferases involved in cell wall biogenesis [uncultured Caudovirales phage]